MNKKIDNPDNIYTQQVKQLIDLIYPQDAGMGSVYEDARHYFSVTPELQKHAEELRGKLDAVGDKDSTRADMLKKKLRSAKERLEDERQSRIGRLENIATKLLELIEGDNHQETQILSAKFLGTVMLQTRGASGNFARLHQRLKPLYKAVLTLRLADKLLEEQTISHPYLSKYKEAKRRFEADKYWRDRYRTEFAMPLIFAAILQDIGLQHPDALTILRGEDGDKDEFRLLEEEQRKQLLKLNYVHTMEYLKNGLGIAAYIGNDKEERDEFVKVRTAMHQFMTQVIQDAFISKTGIGELLKIPQIYVSIVLSTKSDYSRKGLPKAYLLIEQLAKKGALNQKLAEAFIRIVGYFPQGFGITFIPRNERGEEKDQYELAIVSRLNPANPAEPVCRIASRSLQYICSGADETISKNVNLYFPANRKKLMRLGKERLTEIMSQLSGDFNPEDIDELIPSYWEPHDYFGFKKNQNLWNKG